MTKANYKAWAGNWYRGGANWLENRLNNTLNKDEEHDDRVMMRDAMTKLNQAADEIDRLYQVERERNEALEREQALAAHVERLRKASLDAIHYLPGGEIKAELRDAYDDTPETSLTRRDLIKQAEAVEQLIRAMRQPMHEGGQPWLIRVEDAQFMANELRQQAEAL